MIPPGIKLSPADKLRLAKHRQEAAGSSLSTFAKNTAKSISRLFSRKPSQLTPVDSKLARTTRCDFQESPLPTPQHTAFTETITRITPDPESPTIELTREECFCSVIDILFEAMTHSDKTAKEAAKHLLLVMENEVGNSVSLLVYNSNVRMYNSLRQEYFLSTAANIKAKTIKISADIIESLEQMAKTVRLEIPPQINMPKRSS